jgi:hypothetical protein
MTLGTLVAAGLFAGLAVALPTAVPASAHTTGSAISATNQQSSTTVNVKNAAGSTMRQDVFVRGPNNTLAHRWRTVGSTIWSDWKLLDLHLDSAPVAIQNPDPVHSQGVIHVFYNTQANSDHTSSIERIGLDLNGNMVFHENLGSRHCEHSLIGFCAPTHLGIISAPAVLSRGQLGQGYYHEEVFALEDAHTMVHRWLVANDGRAHVWSDWEVLSRAYYRGDPAAISLGTNRMDVFIRSIDDHIYQKTYNGKWGLWQDLGGNYRFSPTVTSLAADSMTIFAFNINNISGRTFAHGSWGPWTPNPAARIADVGVGASPSATGAQYDLVFPDNRGYLYVQSVSNNGNSITTNLISNIGQATSAPAVVVGIYPT